MLSNLIPKRSYIKLKDKIRKGEQIPCFTKTHEENLNCDQNNCLDCLLDELKNEDWKHSPENVFLKSAYEKKIIQNLANSLNELNKEDKKNLQQILTLYNLKYEHIL